MKASGVILAVIAISIAAPLAAEVSPDRCSLMVYPVGGDGNLAEEPLVVPEDVVVFEKLEDPVTGESAWNIEVSEMAAERVYSYSNANVGGYLATFCGQREMSRARIRAPFRGRFRIAGGASL